MSVANMKWLVVQKEQKDHTGVAWVSRKGAKPAKTESVVVVSATEMRFMAIDTLEMNKESNYVATAHVT